MTDYEEAPPPRFGFLTILEGAALGTVLTWASFVGWQIGTNPAGRIYLTSIDEFVRSVPLLLAFWVFALVLLANPVWRMLRSAGYHGYATAGTLGFLCGCALMSAMFVIATAVQAIAPSDNFSGWRCLDAACTKIAPESVSLVGILLAAFYAAIFGLLCAVVGLYMRFRAATPPLSA